MDAREKSNKQHGCHSNARIEACRNEKEIWSFTFRHPLFHPDHQPRRDANMHKQLYIDQVSLEVSRSTDQRKGEKTYLIRMMDVDM